MPNVYQELATHVPDKSRAFIRRAGQRDISHLEMDVTTAHFAGVLVDAGIRRGNIVALLLDKSAEALMLYLAICRIGAVALPVHTGLTEGEIGYILENAEPALVVCGHRWEEWVYILTGQPPLTLDQDGKGSFISALASAPPVHQLADMPPEASNALVYTSGTTGRPKGAWISTGQVIWNVTAIRDVWGITADDILLHVNLMAYGIFATMLPLLAAGASIRLVPDASTDGILDNLHRVTMIASVPTVYHRLLQDPRLDRAKCSKMRLFITGSAPMREDLFAQFQERTGHQLLDRYGMTEALLISSNRIDEPRQAGNCGYALPGSEIRIRMSDGGIAAAGTVGAIEVRQCCPFTGYLHDPAKTAATFSDDQWLITGDSGYLDAQGRLVVLGRGADLIISGGLNVYPKEIELVINAMAGVLDCAVIGIPHPDYGEAVVAVVEMEDGWSPFSEEEARSLLRRSLAGYKVPKYWKFVERLPRNALGKVKKNELQTLIATRIA